MNDLNKPIRGYELRDANIFKFVDPDSDEYVKDLNDVIPESISEILLELTCNECGEASYMVIEPALEEVDGAYYPIMRVRRVSYDHQ